MKDKIDMDQGTYIAREQVGPEINSEKAAKNDNRNSFRWKTLLIRGKSSKKLQAEMSQSSVSDEKKNNFIQRPLPDIPREKSDSNYASISELSLRVDPEADPVEFFEEITLKTNKSDSDYTSISELSLNVDQNDVSTKSPSKIWDNLTLSSKGVLKNIASNPIFESIKSVLKESLGDKSDCKYIVAKYTFVLIYVKQLENSNYLPMNGVKSPTNLEILFEKMVSIILQDFDWLFHTKISHSGNPHENAYSLMKSEPVYANQLSNHGFFKKDQEGELNGVQEGELSSLTQIVPN